jgi:hypothetical protein
MTVVRSTARYDKRPTVVVPGTHRVWIGADAWLEVDRHASDGGRRAPLVVVDTYPGVEVPALVAAIHAALPHYVVINSGGRLQDPLRDRIGTSAMHCSGRGARRAHHRGTLPRGACPGGVPRRSRV